MAHTDHDSSHPSSDRPYWVTAGILAVLTAAEVALFVLNEGEAPIMAKWIEVALLLILSFAKGTLVVSIFMHLKGDAGVFKVVFLAPFLMASAMIISFLLVYGSPHVGIAG